MTNAKAIFLILVAIVVSVFITYQLTSRPEEETASAKTPSTKASKKSTPKTADEPPPVPLPKPVTVEKTLQIFGPGMITAPARKHWAQEFTIDPQAMEPQLKGRFEAVGGTKDDVDVLVMLPDDYTNWSHNNAISASRLLYRSGRTKVGDIQTPTLTPGARYFLVVDNFHAIVFSRNVSLSATLHYKTIEYR